MEEIKVFAFMMECPLFKKYDGRLKEMGLDGGHYNGYVAFNADLPDSWMGLASFDREDVLDNMVDVHGGITFDSHFLEKTSIIPLTEIPIDWYKYRTIGFDCAHAYDTEEEWTFEATKNETLSLYEQIKGIIKNNKL